MKRSIAMLLALLMVFSLSVSAFASTVSDDEKGSITINGVSENTTYKIYKLLDLESYDTTSGAYSYKVNEKWAGFFANTSETDLDAMDFFSIDQDGYVTWTWTPPTVNEGEELPEGVPATEDDAIAYFAKLALAYAKANTATVPVIKSSANDGEFTITGTSGKFADLPLGYYLVDSSMGALCGLTTTNPNASVNVKNGTPTIDKKVQEDSTEQYGASNTADIGQIVEYMVTINVAAGAENYVLHDKMANGLTFVHNPATPAYPGVEAKAAQHRGVWKIEHIIPGSNNVNTHTTVPAYYYSVVTTGLEEGCDFEIRFTPEFCEHLQKNDKIVVYYNAMLNRDAVITDKQDGPGNDNSAVLTYAEGGRTNEPVVTTRTFAFDLVKTDDQNNLIDGAKFKIYDAAADGNEVPVVILSATRYIEADHNDPATEEVEYLLDSQGQPIKHDFDGDNVLEDDELVFHIESYRRARTDETGIDIIVCNGEVRIVGLDNGTYYLHETEAPDGYNILSSRHRFIISNESLDAIFNDGIYSTGSGVQVKNKTGAMLPETGGMGTVLFLTFGMFVVLGTGVLLVTKKRMTMIVE